MSDALATSSRLKPEIRLAQAVSQFEADLPSEQKKSFQKYRHDSPPNANDVIRLTAEIDQQASGKFGRGRCFGPRLFNVLQAVQQFAALGDILIGGSQSMIACGVWSLVRMTLLGIASSNSYFEKLSHLFMIAGRTAPRHQAMALLYPRSKELQSSLTEYIIVVVRICHQVLKFMQMSAAGKLVSSLNDSNIKTYQAELDLWANSAKEQLTLLIAQKTEDEARENSKFRAISNKFSKTSTRESRLKAKLRLIELCSTYDYQTTWKQIRKVGNVTLFSQSSIYQEWTTHPDSCTLIYTGKLGSGKSVLMANIVDHLNLHVPKLDLAVAYFFCRPDIYESLKARTVIGSLARQLLDPIPDLFDTVGFLDDTTLVLDFDGIFNILRQALPPNFKIYFVLDGLDECDNTEKKILAEQFRKLQETFTLILCISNRLNIDDTWLLGQFTAPSVISIPDNNPDIEIFINFELERCLKSGKLAIGDHTLILEIEKALLEGAQGMFLWVHLQIECLCAERTDEAIRQALANLPKGLSETFSRILQKSETLGKSYQKRILELVAVAHHPLTAEELRETLSVVPGDTTWSQAKLVNNISSTLACCGSLITIDEEELTVRLVHHSVKQFLVDRFKDSYGIPFSMNSAHRDMVDIIVTYLNYGVFDTKLTMVAPKVMIGSLPSRIIYSTLNSGDATRSLALKLLRSKKQPDYDISKALAKASKHIKPRSANEFRFYLYAKAHLIYHIGYISEQKLVAYNLLFKILAESMLDTISNGDSGKVLLEWAIKNGHEAIVKLLLDTGQVDIDSKCISGSTPLSWAVRNGNKAIVKLILDTGKVDVNPINEYGNTLLLLAVKCGDETIIKLLLDKGQTDINYKDEDGKTLLSWVTRYGHKAIVKSLLDTGKADINSKDINGNTALSWATRNGHTAIVKLLLDTGKADINSKDINGNTALSWATRNGHTAIVKLILDTGKVDIDSKDEDGKTPLSWAAIYGNKAIVKLLLDTGKIDVNSEDKNGNTALSWATEYGHKYVEKLLYDVS